MRRLPTLGAAPSAPLGCGTCAQANRALPRFPVPCATCLLACLPACVPVGDVDGAESPGLWGVPPGSLGRPVARELVGAEEAEQLLEHLDIPVRTPYWHASRCAHGQVTRRCSGSTGTWLCVRLPPPTTALGKRTCGHAWEGHSRGGPPSRRHREGFSAPAGSAAAAGAQWGTPRCSVWLPVQWPEPPRQ